MRGFTAVASGLVLATLAVAGDADGQLAPGAPASVTVDAIKPPRAPIPAEALTAGITKFSFIAYGDTRGRRDGVNEQYEHSLIVESILRTIKAAESGSDPIRFVLQTGDAVVNGRDARQWNVSFVGLINQITTVAGIPYFLALPGGRRARFSVQRPHRTPHPTVESPAP